MNKILIESINMGIPKEVTWENEKTTDKKNTALIIREKVSLKK